MPDEPEVTDLQTDSLSRFYQVRGEVISLIQKTRTYLITLIHKLMFLGALHLSQKTQN